MFIINEKLIMKERGQLFIIEEKDYTEIKKSSPLS
jgi:hypothetical protein